MFDERHNIFAARPQRRPYPAIASGQSFEATVEGPAGLIFRVQGSNDLVIKHEIATGGPAGVVVVDSSLIDPEPLPKTSSSNRPGTTTKSTARTPRTGKVLDRSRWYVPVPVVNLILRCVGNR